ncbi:acyl-CoA thioesterase [Halieaceae bacterium IMCC14734]|uniref:Acyl-CoA thioesterase n=1 Tax=Candidatus Litorirhabdus singularis TaxID=2518993 RepID=A0ABT3THS7_9GAMM|nr:thioesterase family protein [Candidatus Litorirhabdus singularis]MCX2981882.1 acyl-CoA thioesterase [Candidatus Litorirhabdus singularis]
MSQEIHHREDYRWFQPITTRWLDNDIYGHVNNVIYYSWFDTIANNFLITEGGIDIQGGDRIGYIVHSQCNYNSAIAYPESVEAGFRVNRLGNSSVEYGIGIFRQDIDDAAAWGTFTHVFVDRVSERPVAIDGKLKQALESVLV